MRHSRYQRRQDLNWTVSTLLVADDSALPIGVTGAALGDEAPKQSSALAAIAATVKLRIERSPSV
jgi:hypothetical protein